MACKEYKVCRKYKAYIILLKKLSHFWRWNFDLHFLDAALKKKKSQQKLYRQLKSWYLHYFVLNNAQANYNKAQIATPFKRVTLISSLTLALCFILFHIKSKRSCFTSQSSWDEVAGSVCHGFKAHQAVSRAQPLWLVINFIFGATPKKWRSARLCSTQARHSLQLQDSWSLFI